MSVTVTRAASLLSTLCCLLALSGAVAAPATKPAPAPLSVTLQAEAWSGDLDGMLQRRYIRVLVPYSKTLYFVDLGGAQRGISFEFMRAFEESLNSKRGSGKLRVHAVFIPVSRANLLPLLIAGKGDVAAANLTITPERQKLVDFVVPGATGIREVFVTGPGAPRLTSLDDLAGKDVYVNRATSYYEHLVELNRTFRQRGLAPIRLREAPGHFETEDVFEMLNAGLVKIAVADHYMAQLWRQVLPGIQVREDLVLHAGGEIAFAVRKNSPKLKAELDAFTRTHAKGSMFGNVLLKRYLGQTRWVKNATSEQELRKFNQLVGLFRKYGERYDVDWLLMAAQGYQESQLDQARRSQVGAIGVMQVMPATGRELDVGDITQLEPNVHAGVKYMRFMVDRYYRDEPMDALNKALFTFASYNAGPARIRSLRREAQERGLDPNVWFDNVERVVADRVGRETVQYVSSIYKYYIAYTLVQEDVAADADAAR